MHFACVGPIWGRFLSYVSCDEASCAVFLQKKRTGNTLGKTMIYCDVKKKIRVNATL